MTARALAILLFGVCIVLFGQWLVSCSEVAELRDRLALSEQAASKKALELNEALKRELANGVYGRMERLDDGVDELYDLALPDGLRELLQGSAPGTDEPDRASQPQ